MFAKLRRRLRPADPVSARPPAPVAPPRPDLAVADSETVARTERIRTALHEAGADMDALGPEPTWFAELRGGHPTPLGPGERAELCAYLGVTTATVVASEEACTELLQQIDALVVHREMRDEGFTLMCRGRLNAGSLRAIQKMMRDAVREHDEEQQQAPQPDRSPTRPRRRPLHEAADYLEGH